jgi:hypothetical protein
MNLSLHPSLLGSNTHTTPNSYQAILTFKLSKIKSNRSTTLVIDINSWQLVELNKKYIGNYIIQKLNYINK